MAKLRASAVFVTPILLASSLLPAFAQPNRNNNAYNNGMRRGERGGHYYSHNDRRYRDDYYRQDNGIGPGKGALIGAAAGGLLGAAFGGGLQGTIIAGAAGAGIGAVVGQSAQDNRRRDQYGRPY